MVIFLLSGQMLKFLTEAKAKAIFADYVIKTGEFSTKKDEKNQKTLSFNFGEKENKKKKAYGGLFD